MGGGPDQGRGVWETEASMRKRKIPEAGRMDRERFSVQREGNQDRI